MPRWSVFLVLMFVIASVLAFDPGVQAQALDAWQTLQPLLADIKEGLVVIFDEITNSATDIPSENTPPFDDGPVYNANLAELLA
ncbi:MAG: hypothetical protein AB1649_31665 [Chloroflexota bacterium]